MKIEVRKIGTGTLNDPIRPETEHLKWILIEDKENTMIIEVES